MSLLDNFKSFVRRVMKAVKGKLSPKDEKRLMRLFTRIRKKNKILSVALISALKSGGATEEEIKRISILLERADHRLMNDKEPFTKTEEEEIKSLFEKTKIPPGVFYKIMYSLDELLSYELSEAVLSSQQNPEIKTMPKKKERKDENNSQQNKNKEFNKLL